MKRIYIAHLAFSSLSLLACGGPAGNEFSQGTGAVSQTAAGGAEAEAGAPGSGGAFASGGQVAQGGADAAQGGADSVPDAGPNHETAGAGGATASAGSGGSAGAPVYIEACQPELCNGKDDDCDGVTDEGCPTGFLPGNALQRKAIGDSFGGGTFADTCAADELLVGLNVGVGAWLDQVTAICQKYALHADTQMTPYRYELALGSKRELLAHPAGTTSPVQELSCRGGTVMVGVRVSQQHSAYGQDDDTIVMPRIWIKCAEPSLSLSDSQPHVSWQNVVELGPVSGAFANSEAWYESDLLAASELLVGLHGASGAWIDRIGLTAGALRVVLRPQ